MKGHNAIGVGVGLVNDLQGISTSITPALKAGLDSNRRNQDFVYKSMYKEKLSQSCLATYFFLYKSIKV